MAGANGFRNYDADYVIYQQPDLRLRCDCRWNSGYQRTDFIGECPGDVAIHDELLATDFPVSELGEHDSINDRLG